GHAWQSTRPMVPPGPALPRLPATHFVTMGGTHNSYVLPTAFQDGDTLAVQLTSNAVWSGIANDSPTMRFRVIVHLPDAAPFFTLSLTHFESNTATANNRFILPGNTNTGAVAGGSGDPYVAQAPDEWFEVFRPVTGNWRIAGGTPAQRITGDIEVAAGLGGTRTATLTPAGITKAQVPPGRVSYDRGPYVALALGPSVAGASTAGGSALGPQAVPPGRITYDTARGVPGPPGAAGADGAAGAGGDAILAVVDADFGASPASSGSFVISGLTGLVVDDPVLVTMAVDPADPTASEEQVVLTVIDTSTTEITVYWESVSAMFSGTHKVQYVVSAAVSTFGNFSPGEQLGLQIDAAGAGAPVKLSGKE